MDKSFITPLNALLRYINTSGHKGYDPYDALNSPFLKGLKSKWLRIAFTVFFRLSPFNLRKIFLIQKDINPKAMGLLLSSYAKLYELGISSTHQEADHIFKWLGNNYTKGYSGYCWGYNFPWQSRVRLLKKATPTVVNTAFIGHGCLDYYEISENKEAFDVARSACRFILNDLNIYKNESGICFSYTPMEKNIVHNANVLGASLLARVYSYTKEEVLSHLSTRSVDFTLNYQQKNGLWAYSMDPATQKERFQTDWHQGFILDSLMIYIRSLNPSDKKYKNALNLGAAFYKNQFAKKGKSYWRYPKKWPIDIHNQAQGIITFSKLEKFIPGSVKNAQAIAEWTVNNMMDTKEGYFYYQKWPFFRNKIPYFRWGQAWMMHALIILLHQMNTYKESNLR